ncbi:MAG: hypothetical protein R3C04_05830 [Hyphomonas sp.]
MQDWFRRFWWGCIAHAARLNVVALGILSFLVSLASTWLAYFRLDWFAAVASTVSSAFGLLAISGLWGQLRVKVSALSQLTGNEQRRRKFIANSGAKLQSDAFVIDLDTVMRNYGSVLNALKRPQTPKDHKLIGLLNASAYLGTTFGLFANVKERRNRSLFDKNPDCFLVNASDGKDPFNVVTCVLPMSENSYGQYLRRKVSDNEFSPSLLNAPGEPADIAHIFMLAAETRHVSRARFCSFDECVAVTLFAHILLIAPDPKRGIECVFSAGEDIIPLLRDMGFVPSDDFNGDDLEMWSCQWVFEWHEPETDAWVRGLRGVSETPSVAG